MINFRASRIVRLITMLEYLEDKFSGKATEAQYSMLPLDERPIYVDDSDRKIASVYAVNLNRALELLGSTHVNDALQHILDRIDSPVLTWSEAHGLLLRANRAVRTELRQHFFYHYKQAKGRMVDNFKDEWSFALLWYPPIENDAFAATDLYALGHNTASIFHSMRVAEFGLRVLAKDQRVKLDKGRPLEWGTWQEIISKIETKREHVAKKMRAGRSKDRELAFYSGVLADLHGFKDEYRNSVSHLRAEYDEHQAIRALSLVHSFIDRVAARLKPIR